METMKNEKQEALKSEQEQQKETKADISAPEAENGQEGAENEATGASEAYIIGVDMAAGEDMTADALEIKLKEIIWQEAERQGISIWELEEQWEKFRAALLKVGEMLKEAFQEMYEKLKPTFEKIFEAYAVYAAKECPTDKWQIEKMMMSNNERRRKGIPMVRRQAHLQNERNSRKRRQKK